MLPALLAYWRTIQIRALNVRMRNIWMEVHWLEGIAFEKKNAKIIHYVQILINLVNV